MDEVIVRLCRTLACHERLQILGLLIADGEKSPTAMADALHMSPNALSSHLAKLTTVGLIRRRRSGRWSYCVAASPYADSTLSGKTLAWLRELLKCPESATKLCGNVDAQRGSSRTAPNRLYAVLFETFTAFTDLRRLQILRYLRLHGESSAETLRQKLRMSLSSVLRHTEKLTRRGYLATRVGEDGPCYCLAARLKTPIHARMWEIVRAADKQGLHTS